MSKIKSFLKEKRIQKVFFDDIGLVERFLNMCEKTDDVKWCGGQHPRYELDTIKRHWQTEVFYNPAYMTYCEFCIEDWNDGTIRFCYSVDSFPTKTQYTDTLANKYFIDCKDLLLQLGLDLIILNKEEQK